MARNADSQVRAVQALDLRQAGASYRQIGNTLGVSHVTAFRYVRRLLREHTREPAEQIRDAEIARLDRLLMGHWGKAIGGDVNATRTVLSIMDRRAKLLGLDAPPRIDLTGWIREMAIAEGLDPDQAVKDAESIVRRSNRDA